MSRAHFIVESTKKEQEKIEYYTDLKYEILKCWHKEVDKIMILPIIIGTLVTVIKNLRKNVGKLDLNLDVVMLQKTYFLGTAQITWKVLDII